MTVIATGFDKEGSSLPKMPVVQEAAPVPTPVAPPQLVPLQEEDVPKETVPEDDFFEDIFKIFNKHD